MSDGRNRGSSAIAVWTIASKSGAASEAWRRADLRGLSSDLAAGPQGEGRVAQKFAHGEAVANGIDTPVEHVQHGGDQGLIVGVGGVDEFGEQGAADDDLASGLAFATVDRPERFKAFDPGFQDGKPLGVVGDRLQRPAVAAHVDAALAFVTQRRFQLGKPGQKRGLPIGRLPLTPIVSPGHPQVPSPRLLRFGSRPVL